MYATCDVKIDSVEKASVHITSTSIDAHIGPNIGNLSWRENVFNSKKIAAYWRTLCEKNPLVREAERNTA